MRAAMIDVFAVVTIIAAFALISFVTPILEGRRSLRYLLHGENDGEGLLALTYVLRGRDDLWTEFIMALISLIVGTLEWALIVRWLMPSY